MSLLLEAEAPPLRVDPDGSVRVGKTRVLLVLVVRAFQDGATPEEIVQRYDTLDLGDVYSVIGYHLRHRAEIDAVVAEYDRAADEVRRKIEAAQAHLPDIRSRLLAARRAGG